MGPQARNLESGLVRVAASRRNLAAPVRSVWCASASGLWLYRTAVRCAADVGFFLGPWGKGGGLSVILPYVGFDGGFAVLPALRAAIRQGRVAWGHLMVSSAAMQSGLPSNWAHAFYLIHAATLPKIR